MDQDKKPMGIVVNWKNEVAAIAGPFQPTDTKQSWLSRAASKAGVSLRLIQSIYYGHTVDPKYSIAQSVLSAADRARREASAREAKKLADSFEDIAGGLNAKDQDFYRADVNSLLHAARILRQMDGA